MPQSHLVDIIGLFHTDREIPSVLFPVRSGGSRSSLDLAIGGAISRRIISRVGEGVPAYRPGYRVEAVEPERLTKLATELGLTATQPEDILNSIRENEIAEVCEVNDVGWE